MNLPQDAGTKVNARITTPKNTKDSIDLATSPQKTAFVSGEQLRKLRGDHFVNKKLYGDVVIVIDELPGMEAGSLRITIRFGMSRAVMFTLGWKNKFTDVYIGDDSFRIELV